MVANVPVRIHGGMHAQLSPTAAATTQCLMSALGRCQSFTLRRVMEDLRAQVEEMKLTYNTATEQIRVARAAEDT